ncbi:hypothetical protein [Arundinibacter roseus]|uniref:HK97 gp10 family phage protein n=1 Tax=Arundinibacter roseus TaxID=2070510 RepID=A0A4R4KFQ3_9BACT|nr:hypothetical protein [Arundinibacter roseus]TDB66800.1 hypothetical protein EZE20_06655 [Arundinibacter roseus]
MIADDLSQEILDLATEITRDAVGYFEKAIERSGLLLTSELRNSFEYQINHQAGQLAVSGDIYFKGYGRMKDMRSLTYLNMPSVDVLEEYVDKVGLDKFAFVNRFGQRKLPTKQSDARHIAWAIAMHKKRIGTVRRKRSSTWYNRTKVDFMNVMRRRMMERTQVLVMRALKEQAEGK